MAQGKVVAVKRAGGKGRAKSMVPDVRFLCKPKPGYGLGYAFNEKRFYVFKLVSDTVEYPYGQIMSVGDGQRASSISYRQANVAYHKVTGSNISEDGVDFRMREQGGPRRLVFEDVNIDGGEISELPGAATEVAIAKNGEGVDMVILDDLIPDTPAGKSKPKAKKPTSKPQAVPELPPPPQPPSSDASVDDITKSIEKTAALGHRDMGTVVFLFIRYGGFVLATAVSALFNIFLFTSLDRSYVWLLIAFSVSLEFTKVSSIVGAHIFKDLFLKTKLKRLVRYIFVWYASYFALACFSIVASLGFSLTVTAKTQAVQDAELERLRQQHASIEAQIGRIEEQALIDRVSIDDYTPYREADVRYQTALDNFDLANSRYQAALAAMQRLPQDHAERPQAVANTNAAWTERSGAVAARNTALAERDLVKNGFDERKAFSAEVTASLREELQTLFEQSGLDTVNGQVALLMLQEKISLMEERIIREKGMSYMFSQFAIYAKQSEATVKLVILMFASLMLELTIMVSSPSIPLTRRVLRFFVHVLPRELDMDALIAKIDADNVRFRR
jgi:hypothetical protein